jgi:diguanylate cyclase (GGDEF)-like protein
MRRAGRRTDVALDDAVRPARLLHPSARRDAGPLADVPITRLVAHQMANAGPARRAGWSALIPHGRTLPAGAWGRRHRILRGLLWMHALALPALAFAAFGLGPMAAGAHGAPVLLLAVLAGLGRDRRRQAVAVAAGLLTASAMIVHASGGPVEAHFHVFLVLTVLALYEDWLPFGIAVGFVALHDLGGAVLVPVALDDAPGHALGPALAHAGFVLAVALANLVTWRVNEDMRQDAAAARRAVEAQYEVSHALSGAVTLEDAAPRLLAAIGRGLGADMGVIWRPTGPDLSVHPATIWAADPAHAAAMAHFVSEPIKSGQGLAGRAWGTGEPAWSGDVAALIDEARRPAVVATGQRSGVAVPIRTGDEVLGVLTFTAAGHLRADDAVTDLLGSICSQIAVFMDRLRRSEDLVRMEDEALCDPLTGLANRRAWDRALARELDAHRGIAGRLSVAVIDLDHFKRFNDAHGHLAGDQLLRGAAAAWSDCIRERDLLARLGGDEFGLLFPGTPAEDAALAADRLRAALPHQQRCSVGVATWDGTEPGEALVERADRALYAAKRRGRPLDAPHSGRP